MKRISSPEVQMFETRHISQVRQAAPECMVLLKYDGRFPVKPGRIAVYGGGARHTIKGGTGSGDVNVRSMVTAEQGLLNAGFEITSGAWLDAYDKILARAQADFALYLQKLAAENTAALSIFGLMLPEPEYDLPTDAPGDTAVYILSRNSGEGADRKAVPGDIDLTETEKRDILAISARYERFMLVLNVGGMVDLTPVRSHVGNILLLSQLGTPTGDALADVLCGKAYPSGKLAMTWAPIDSYPSTPGFGAPEDTRYTEGVFVGYRYFDTFGVERTFPFGFGLGYTAFALQTLSFTADESAVSVRVSVRNTGRAPGKEVVQLYYGAPDGKLAKPRQELAAYEKTRELAPGEEQTLTLAFPTAQMASYDASRAAFILEPGVYEVLCGVSSDDTTRCGSVLLEREVITRQVRNVGGTPDFEDLAPAARKEPVSVDGAVRLDPSAFPTETARYGADPSPLAGKAGTWDDVKQGRITLEEFVGGLTDEQLAYLCIGNYRDLPAGASVMEIIGNASSRMAGAAGETTGRLRDLGVPALTMPDGPAGLRLSTEYVLRDGRAVSLVSSLNPDERLNVAPDETVCYQYCVAIPIGTALAQAWNPEIPRLCGSLVGEEMELFGANLWLAPALNIHRNPMCGRNFEYYSEDPLVAGLTAAAVTKGVQAHPGCATTVKHFCCNNQETNRMHSNSILSERALREIYLRGFEICVRQAQPHCVMSSYNLLNGEHVNNRRCIQTHVLRDEWGFEGFVMTDWLTTVHLPDRAQKYGIASAAGCVRAGNDMIMPGLSTDFADIMDALARDDHPYHLTRAYLEQDALHILRVIEALA